MRILFCNIAYMKYYKGIFPGIDEPANGGSYVKDNKDAHEKYNFEAVSMENIADGLPDGDYCLGFVETKTTKVKRNQLHIEKIEGCTAMKGEDYVDDVLVIYCATHDAYKHTAVVGWYKHARVYRDYAICTFGTDNPDEVYEQFYNAIANAENCVLLPTSERSRVTKWKVPRKGSGASYGFGQANVWFAEGADDNPYLKDFLIKITTQINEYQGENLLYKYPEI